MKLVRVKIENVKSFLGPTQIEFGPKLNILVGPNAGGKSNMLSILTVVINHFFLRRLDIKTDVDAAGNVVERLEVVKMFDRIDNELDKFFGNTGKSRIEVTFQSDDIDYQNMKMLWEVRGEIQKRLERYKNTTKLHFPGDWHRYFSNNSVITYEIVENGLSDVENDSKEHAYLTYLNQFYYAKQLTDDFAGVELRAPTIFLPPMRTLGDAFRIGMDSIKNQQYYSQVREFAKVHSGSGSHNISSLAMMHFSRKLRRCEYDAARDGSGRTLYQRFARDKEVQQLERFLAKVGFSWKIEEDRVLEQYVIRFVKNDTEFGVSKASSGEKEILNFLFSMFTLGLNGGVVFIDEPEIHLHPRWQLLLLSLFDEFSKSHGVQFVVSTHSSIFVRPNTINDVFRLYQSESGSQVVAFGSSDLPEKPELTRMLNSHNNERILFADHVILVEGIVDRLVVESLVSYYTDHLPLVRDVEVVEVLGKHNFDPYVRLLNASGIPWSVIADFDYLVEVGSEGIKDLFEVDYIRIDRGVLNAKDSKDRRTLTELLGEAVEKGDFGALQNFLIYMSGRFRRFRGARDVGECRRVISELDRLRGGSVYVLRRGEIEDYLPKGVRTTNEVIEMLRDTRWFCRSRSLSAVLELHRIVLNILDFEQGRKREAMVSVRGDWNALMGSAGT